MTLEQFLAQIVVSVSANAIYGFLRTRLAKSREVNAEKIKKELAAFLNIKNAEIAAEKIINFLAINGDIEIKGSKIFAKNSIFYSSDKSTKFSLEESRSETKKTRIDVGKGAQIKGQGGAAIKQNENGSISFST